MNNLQIGQEVKVTITVIDGDDMVFASKIVDLGGQTKGYWVEHPSLDGDWLFVNLSNPNINNVEAVANIEVATNQEMKAIKADLLKVIKYLDDVSIAVKVYDCTENNEQTYDVEIDVYVDGNYEDGFYNQTFYGRFDGDKNAEKMAVNRAKAVLRTVKGWFKNDDEITVKDEVEVYHV